MECPNCKKTVIIPRHAYLNLQNYNVGGSVLVSSECCGKGFNVKMNISYSITEYKGYKKEDNWGCELT